jgi:predicted DNA-binding transcriptional regulator AlpA
MRNSPEISGKKSVLSVDEFCADNGISRATFYNIRREGRGPAEMKVGTRTLISAEAAEAWRRRIEAETSAA